MAVRVEAEGNLTRDIELRFSEKGTAWARFSIAVNEQTGPRDGDRQEVTTYVDCKVFGQMAENLAESTAKGSRVLIKGRERQESWNDSAGVEKSARVVIVDDIYVPLRWQTAKVTKNARNNGGFSTAAAPATSDSDDFDPIDAGSPFR